MDKTFNGQNISWKEHFMDRTFYRQNISWTEHFMERTFHRQNISWTEHFLDRTFNGQVDFEKWFVCYCSGIFNKPEVNMKVHDVR